MIKVLTLQWRIRVFLAVISGYLTAILALPAAATVLAAAATASDAWGPVSADTPARVPVYWVGDRVVYLTTEGGSCFVSVQIAGALQTKRKCPPLVTAIKP